MIYQIPPEIERMFAGSVGYRHLIYNNEVHESAGRYFPYTERHLHALWFDARLRPKELKTSRGEAVTVENPGRWNLEAGPDFSGAVLLIGREKRRVAGDAEIHIFPNDWKNHGHYNDPRYANVRFHITWFPGTSDESLFPPGTIHLSYHDVCTTDLESIDLSAYPYQEPRAAAEFPMFGKNPDEIFQTLESAGEQRLRQKTLRMAWLVQQRGDAQALYEETAAALGYKHNKAPLRKLAQKFPLEALVQYGSDWKTIYAVLLGISGLLPKQPAAHWPDEARNELRALWDIWWREQHKWEEVEVLTRADWNFSSLRPLNHPIRRLAALAQWAASSLFSASRPDGGTFLRNLQPCFWTTHIGWCGKEKRAEIVGKDRAQAIFLNVVIPYRLAKGQGDLLKHLPIEPMNSIIRETAYQLFGPDHSPKLYCTALARQGLIQVFNDFILTDRLNEFY